MFAVRRSTKVSMRVTLILLQISKKCKLMVFKEQGGTP
jgi:hypothetical protein